MIHLDESHTTKVVMEVRARRLIWLWQILRMETIVQTPGCCFWSVTDVWTYFCNCETRTQFYWDINEPHVQVIAK